MTDSTITRTFFSHPCEFLSVDKGENENENVILAVQKNTNSSSTSTTNSFNKNNASSLNTGKAIVLYSSSDKALTKYNSKLNNSRIVLSNEVALPHSTHSTQNDKSINRLSAISNGLEQDVVVDLDVELIFPTLDLFGLIFVYDGVRLKLQIREEYSIDRLLQIGEVINEYFVLINSKGYISETLSLKPLFHRIQDYLKYCGVKLKGEFGQTENTFTLWFNLIKLNLFHLCTVQIKEGRDTMFDDESLDKLCDLECLRDNLLDSLDPYLRVQIQKRGITFIANTYTGFDTEFTLLDSKNHLNKLISAQSAVQTRALIKVPMYKLSDVSYVHPLTSEITNFFKPSDMYLTSDRRDGEGVGELIVAEMGIINDSLKDCVEKIRKFKFSTLDAINRELITKLKTLQDIKYYEDSEKDCIVFALPLSQVYTKITYPQSYSTQELVSDSNWLGFQSLEHSFNSFADIIASMEIKPITNITKLKSWYSKTAKPRSRTTLHFNTLDKIALTVLKNNYIIAHYNPADLSLLSDFYLYKDELSIVNKSFISLSKPLEIANTNVYFRDTHLLTPAGSKGLNALGKLYSAELNLSKIELKAEDKEHMDEFLLRDPKTFEEYALRDVLITLKHAVTLESVNFDIKRIGIPITLSSMGRALVLDKWSSIFEQYFPYQISGELLMGNAQEIQTPKGLFATGEVGLYLGHYICNYKGGRNESFMYGCDENTNWFDYDLASAYSTAMTYLTLPDYKQARLLDTEKIKQVTPEQLLQGYWIFNTTFKFPKDTKYPSIPCYVDKTTTVYPLQGQAILTGPEYLVALNQGCKIEIISAFYIPATYNSKKLGEELIQTPITPFKEIIQSLQAKRREYPKGHVLNSLYKELTNSIYGNVVRGMSNKLSFDTKTGKTVRMNATELSNPILASWITAFIRSLIGECLHNIQILGGKVVSVTTDGFITNLKALESLLYKLPENSTPLLRLYHKLRVDLHDDVKNHITLELKSQSKGVISWSTRGQLGLEKGIKATTGFQSIGYSHEELVSNFKEVLSTKEKCFEFTLFSLRSAKDIFKQGGHVTSKYRDQKIRLLYDNRRLIKESDNNNNDNYDMSNTMFDSKPFHTKAECLKHRFLSKFSNKKPYLLRSALRQNSKSKYKDYIEIGVRNFIRGYLAKEPLFGLKGTEFNRYKDIIEFIYGFRPAKPIVVSSQTISKLKHRKMLIRPVPNTRENKALANFIKSKISYFDISTFLKY